MMSNRRLILGLSPLGGWKVGNLLTVTDTRDPKAKGLNNSYTDIIDAKIPLTFLTSNNIALNKIHIDTIKFHIDGFNVHNKDTVYLGPSIDVSFGRDDRGENGCNYGISMIGGEVQELHFTRSYHFNNGSQSGSKIDNETIREYGWRDGVWDDYNERQDVEDSVSSYEVNNGAINCFNDGKQHYWPVESDQHPTLTTSANTWSFYIGSQRHIYHDKNEIQLGPLYIDDMPIKYIYKEGGNNFGLYNTSNSQIYEYDQKMLTDVTVSVT